MLSSAFPRLPFDSVELRPVGVGLETGAVGGADVPLVGRDVFAKVGEAAGAVPAEVAFEDHYQSSIERNFINVFPRQSSVEGVGADFSAPLEIGQGFGILG